MAVPEEQALGRAQPVMLERQRQSLGVARSDADAVLKPFQEQAARPNPVQMYRQLLEQFLANGDISDEERAMLLELQMDHGIDFDED